MMLSSETPSAVNAPQHGPTGSAARDCVPLRLSQPRKSAHASEVHFQRQGARFHLAPLLRPQEGRGSDAHRSPAPTAKEGVHVNTRQTYSVPRRIPPEILGIIFENCLDEQTAACAVLSEPPLLLGRVCRYWRTVSQSTPRLWTRLSLRFLETHVDRSRDGIKVATAVETWLRRSNPAPLSIAFTDNRIFQKDTEDIVIWLLSRIRMHAPRWKAVHLKFSSDYFLQLDVLSSCAFTSLTSFSVHVDHMGWRRSLLSLRFDLTQANRLTSLAYTGPDHVIREDIFVDWTCLTSVAFSYDLHEAGGESATLPRHFSSLALCRNLTMLSIGLSTTLAQHVHQLDAMAQGQMVIPMIELPRLHTLRVRRLSWSAHACALVDALRLPQLSTLQIDSAILVGWDSSYASSSHPDVHPPLLQTHTQTHWWHARHFSALLDRSGCHLHTLHIQDVDMSPLELARLLESPGTLQTLSTFTFEPCPRGRSILGVLAHIDPMPGGSIRAPSSSPSSSSGSPPTPSPTLPSFPSLTHLRLICSDEAHLDPLADLIESRTGDRATQAGVRPLASFELVFYDFVYSHGQGRAPSRKACFDVFKERVLKCAREGGVDVDIRVERPYEPAYLSVP